MTDGKSEYTGSLGSLDMMSGQKSVAPRKNPDLGEVRKNKLFREKHNFNS